MNAAQTPAPGPTAPSQWLTVPDLAERLGSDLSKVRHLIRDRRLIGVRQDGVFRVPAEFLIEEDGHQVVLASLHGTVTVLGDNGLDDEGIVRWLFTADEALKCSPIEALREGRKTPVRRQAMLLM